MREARDLLPAVDLERCTPAGAVKSHENLHPHSSEPLSLPTVASFLDELQLLKEPLTINPGEQGKVKRNTAH
jgi:hypothetical protein